VSPSLRHATLVFRRELLDLRRERRVLGPLLLQPVVFVILMAAPAFFVQRAVNRERATTFAVAVDGDVDAVPGLRDALQAPPFRLTDGDDAIEQVIGQRAELALVVPSDARSVVADGDTVRLRILAVSTMDVTERAIPALTRRLVELGRAESDRLLDEAGAPPTLASPLRIEIRDVATSSPEGIRFGLAQALPALLVIQLFGLVSLTQERIAGAKDKRVLEPLLVLPARRRDLLLGIGAATAIVGALSSIMIFVPLTAAISAAVASISRSLADPITLAGTLAIGGLVLALTFAAIGLLLGARAASASSGSVIVTLVQLTIFAAVIVSPFLDELEAEGPLLAIPVLGPLLFVRDGLASGTPAVTILTMCAAQLAVTLLILRLAARALDQERNVLRTAKA
jgi:ABC-type Na+ efflux pump permease subunit